MIITENFLEMGLYGSTLNKAQCDLLGLSHPPANEWQTTLIGKELSTKDTNLFLLLRGKLALKAQEQIIKNYQLLAEFHNKKDEKTTATPQQTKKNSTSQTVKIYCDGACKGNPGKSGSGLAIYDGGDKPTLLYGEYNPNGTNNTAELNALYKALQLASKSSKAIIYSDSKYSIDCISTWAYGWKRNGWKKKGGEIKNLEVIKETHELYERYRGKITIKHVKGHAGIEGNELADRMAVMAISRRSVDYEQYEYTNISDVIKL